MVIILYAILTQMDHTYRKMIVILFEKRFDLAVKVVEQGRVGSGTLNPERNKNAVAVTVKISTLVIELSVAMCRVELVTFANDH